MKLDQVLKQLSKMVLTLLALYQQTPFSTKLYKGNTMLFYHYIMTKDISLRKCQTSTARFPLQMVYHFEEPLLTIEQHLILQGTTLLQEPGWKHVLNEQIVTLVILLTKPRNYTRCGGR